MVYEPIRDFPDKAVSLLLEHPERFRGFLEVAAPGLAAQIAPSSLRQLDPKLVASSFRAVHEDTLYEGEVRDGRRRRGVVVLLAHQSAPDPLLPFRLHEAKTLLWARDLRDQEEGKVPPSKRVLRPVVTLVLHTGTRTWTPRRLPELFGRIDDPELQATIPDAATHVLDLPSTRETQLLAAPSVVGPLLALFKAQYKSARAFRGTLGRVVQRLVALFQGDWNGLRRWLWFCYQLVGHRRPASEQVKLEEVLARAVGREEVKAMAETWAQTIERRAAAEAAEETERRVRRDDVVAVLEGRFGAVPAEVVESVQAVDDREWLSGLVQKASVVGTLEEFHALLRSATS